MSYDNLYLASSIMVSDAKEPYTESVYTIEEREDKQSTQIIRIAVDKGTLIVGSQCTVDGSLLNQFSLDEFEGNLRVAVTINKYSYRILRDSTYGIESYQYLDGDKQTNAIYVIDPKMNIIGSIEGLAEEERIYSVRFTGPVGYMVTFRQVDPLFALDLSDPTSPRVTSELKIPGFRTYLHPFGDDRLLGLGYDVSSNRTSGMKMSMFDISDPFNVSEMNMELIGIDYSEALYEHKAVLVDVQRNIIGFPGEQYIQDKVYYLYAYSDKEGFILKGVLDLSSSDENESRYYYSSGTRAHYIGEYLYVYSGDFLDVFDLKTLKKVCALFIEAPENPGGAKIVPLLD
jgi:uncharacterized secreted protein with C-terminal beta-propeller domain